MSRDQSVNLVTDNPTWPGLVEHVAASFDLTLTIVNMMNPEAGSVAGLLRMMLGDHRHASEPLDLTQFVRVLRACASATRVVLTHTEILRWDQLESRFFATLRYLTMTDLNKPQVELVRLIHSQTPFMSFVPWELLAIDSGIHIDVVRLAYDAKRVANPLAGEPEPTR